MRIQFELLNFNGIGIIINSLMPIVIEIDNAVRFASNREHYYINKEYLRMKLVIIRKKIVLLQNECYILFLQSILYGSC
jgi:hypothetical protein